MNFGKLGRLMNVFGMLLYAKTFKKRIPVRVALQITRLCNMRCNYCYANFETYAQIKDWTTEETFRVIDMLYEHGTRWIWFLGGEPMLRKDFGAIIDYAQRKGIFCDMNSNGTLINEGNLETVKKLDAVCVSIDGDESSNDHYRGSGSFQKAIRAVQLLRDHKMEVRLHAILTKKTQHSLEAMIELARKYDVTFNYCEVLRNQKDPNDHELSEAEHEQFYRRYLQAKQQGAPIMHSVMIIEKMLQWPKKGSSLIFQDEKQKYPARSFVSCLSGDLQCFLDIDGRMYACNGTWDDGINYHEVGFQKAWDYLAKRKCVACRCIGMTGLHSLLDLSPSFIASNLNNAPLIKKIMRT
jgi:MoaA/NifB/PqqE/SkfB family radical SAM enzyme